MKTSRSPMGFRSLSVSYVIGPLVLVRDAVDFGYLYARYFTAQTGRKLSLPGELLATEPLAKPSVGIAPAGELSAVW